jgi:thiamine kinase-like enzyme
MALNLQCIIEKLQALPFAKVLSVNTINEGYSQQCFELITDKGIFIAKYFSEKNASLLNEYQALTVLKNDPFIADVIYKNDQVLVMNKLPGISLAKSDMSLYNKLNIAVMLMHRCHQQPREHLSHFTSLHLQQVVDALIDYAQLPTNYLQQITLISNHNIEHIQHIVHEHNLVFCHGDINFTNILVSCDVLTNKPIPQAQIKHYLIDFESGGLMPAEYDIAMMLAVNELTTNELQYVCERYQHYAQNSSVNELNETLIEHYYLFALIINGLWYLGKYKETNESVLLEKANAQFALSHTVNFLKHINK